MTGFACPETEALRTTLSIADGLHRPGETTTSRKLGERTGLQAGNVEELALIQRIKSGDFDTRQRLITANLRMALENSKRYARNGVGIFDLLRAGHLGLEHALETYSAESGGRFAEHAAACIRSHVEHALKAAPCPAMKPTAA